MKVCAMQGDTLAAPCFRYYGRTEGVVETALRANPGLSDLGVLLPPGPTIDLPDADTSPTAYTLHLWDCTRK